MMESLSENLDRSCEIFLVELGKIICQYLEHLHKVKRQYYDFKN